MRSKLYSYIARLEYLYRYNYIEEGWIELIAKQ